jgi:hypothetical protein
MSIQLKVWHAILAVLVIVGMFGGQQWYFASRVDGLQRELQEQQARSIAVVSKDIARQVERLGDRIEILGRLGGQTTIERRPGTLVITTQPGRDGKDGKNALPAAPGRDGRPGTDGKPGDPGKTPPGPPGGVTPPIVDPARREEARKAASLTLRVTLDKGVLDPRCFSPALPVDTMEFYVFGDGLGSVNPCIKKLEAEAKVASTPAPARKRLKIVLGSSVSAPLLFQSLAGPGIGLAYEIRSAKVLFLGTFSLDALALYRGQTFQIGLGISRDMTQVWSLGVGLTTPLTTLNLSPILYTTIRF